ncbi:hypothetical protein ACFL2Q_16240 [Thermodesulfobacteriota bacterium]
MANEFDTRIRLGTVPPDRNTVAIVVLIVAGGSILAFAISVLFIDETKAMTIFNSLLPVLGTWVGTVLAFYFSKENFQAANESMTNMARQVTSQTGTGGVRIVREMMIPRKSMMVHPFKDSKSGTLDEMADKILIDTLLEFCKTRQVNRVPVLDKDDKPIAMIHKRYLDEYRGLPETEKKTLKDLFDALPDAHKRIGNGFVPVRPESPLHEAKEMMDALESCRDALVTETGGSDDPVVGWITDDLIRKNARI